MKKQIPFLFLSLIPLCFIILAIWLPYGFTMTGLIEEWGILGLFTTHGPVFLTDIQGPLSIHALRPLGISSHALAYTLDRNSFDYWHVITILSLLIKSMACGYLVRVAIGSRFWAVVAAILVLLFPADTMQLAFRGIGINFALALLLLGCACCVAAFRSHGKITSFILALLSASLLLISLFIYETGWALILLPFMILYVNAGFTETGRLIKSHITVVMLWIIALLNCLIHTVIASHFVESYQGALLGGASPVTVFFHSFPALFSPGIVRSLAGGWFDAIRITFSTYNYIGYAYLFIITGLITGFLLLVLNRSSDTNPKKWMRFALIGLLLLIAGYMPFLFSPGHLVTSQRTFLYATLGAVMVWVAILALLFRWKKWLALSLIIFLIFIGTGTQLFQLNHYMQLSNTERHLIRDIIENFDGNQKNKTLVIFDKSNQLDRVWMLLKPDLGGTLAYFYGHYIDRVEICYLPTGEWRSEWSSPLASSQMGTCFKNKNSWTFRFSTPTATPQIPHPKKPPDIIIPNDKIAAITINADESVVPVLSLTKYRDELRTGNSVTAIRYRNILVREPSQFSRSLWAVDPSHYRWQFGDWWSMELPIKGSGWGEPGWAVNYFHSYAFAWKAHKRATLLFPLKPAQKPYLLRGQFSVSFPAIKDAMQISINGHFLDVKWHTNGKFKAAIPMNTLVSGINTIQFDTAVDPATSGLSGALEWFDISTEKN